MVPARAPTRRWGVPAGNHTQSPGPSCSVSCGSSKTAWPLTTRANSSWSWRKSTGPWRAPLATWHTLKDAELASSSVSSPVLGASWGRQSRPWRALLGEAGAAGGLWAPPATAAVLGGPASPLGPVPASSARLSVGLPVWPTAPWPGLEVSSVLTCYSLAARRAQGRQAPPPAPGPHLAARRAQALRQR